MNTITVTVGSVTYAIKARKILARMGIKSKLVKANNTETAPGCTHGIEISEEHLYTLISALKERGINYNVVPRK
ncbi:MAG: DUF3343 domain-containing protein [Clostridia bacterium]|nr:DUF3343 domain-containing protein [Clostridia bacterium]